MALTNTQRIRNILSGDIKGSTKIISGYKKKREEHFEGDVWEEDERTWTIKNGIKRTINKLDEVRALINMPLSCPKCGKPMKKRLDKKFWQLKNQCFDCTIEEDNERIINGTFQQYSKEHIQQNVESFIDDLKAQVKSYIDTVGSKHFIAENGDIEDWVGGKTKEEIEGIMTKKLEVIEERKTDAFEVK
jgi:ribosomal protein L37AE/L43A